MNPCPIGAGKEKSNEIITPAEEVLLRQFGTLKAVLAICARYVILDCSHILADGPSSKSKEVKMTKEAEAKSFGEMLDAADNLSL